MSPFVALNAQQYHHPSTRHFEARHGKQTSLNSCKYKFLPWCVLACHAGYSVSEGVLPLLSVTCAAQVAQMAVANPRLAQRSTETRMSRTWMTRLGFKTALKLNNAIQNSVLPALTPVSRVRRSCNMVQYAQHSQIRNVPSFHNANSIPCVSFR